jgi:hypothetical protein
MNNDVTTNPEDPQNEQSQTTDVASPQARPRSRSRAQTAMPSSEVAATETPQDESTGSEESMERAEKIVGEWGQRVEQAGTMIGSQLVRLVARTREEAEDIWAEAQHMHQSWTSNSGEDQSETHQG